MADMAPDLPSVTHESTPDPPQTETAKAVGAPDSNDGIVQYFTSRIQAAERNRRRYHSRWKRNVDLRMGNPLSALPATAVSLPTDGMDDIQSEINPDWSLTKTKTANLYSQTPTIRGTSENDQYRGAIAPFVKALNYEIGEKRCKVGTAMEEVLNDVVNAAGIGAVVVGVFGRYDEVSVPAKQEDAQVFQGLPPEIQKRAVDEQWVPMRKVPRMVSRKFYATRISPSNLLWPPEFTGSDFDEATWIGYRDQMTWGEAKPEFKLTDEQKEQVLREAGAEKSQDSLRSGMEKSDTDLEVVRFKRLFYWRYKLDPAETSFECIWEIVFIDGIEKPVRHEQWYGQRFDPTTGSYVGARKLPVRVLTLTYITDNPVPPSDSEAGRPQVNDMRRSRSQMFLNRERSFPIRGFDSTRVDPDIRDLLMRGTPQGMIPFLGPARDAIWEVARASYPAEDLTFDRQAQADLYQSWQLGPNQQGVSQPGERTKAEVTLTQQNFATRIGQERGQTAKHFVGIAEVLAGLMTLYSDYPNLTQEEKQRMMGSWDMAHVAVDIALSVLPDSTIMLDSNQEFERQAKYLNLVVKSGMVNPLPILAKLTELVGHDPAEILKNPDPQQPEQPQMSYRFDGANLADPIVLAMLIKIGQAPSPEHVAAAQALLQSAGQIVPRPAVPAQAETMLMPEGAPGGPPVPTGAPGAVGGPTQPFDGSAHPGWHLPDKVSKRSRDMNAAGG